MSKHPKALWIGIWQRAGKARKPKVKFSNINAIYEEVLPPLNKRYVKERGVEIDELEEEDFQGVAIVELRLCPRAFPFCQLEGQFCVKIVHYEDDDQVNGCGA